MEEEGPPREVVVPPKPKVREEDTSSIYRELEKVKLDLAGKAPWWMFWVLFILLGGVGMGFWLNGFVFKSATWAGYLVGVGGTAIIAWLYKSYKQAEVN